MSIGYNSVYFATNTPIFPSIIGLRTFKNYQDGMMVFTSGNKTQSDQEGAGYTFDSSSTLEDDGYFVIKPTAIDNNSAGRWVIVNANSINKNIVSTGYLNLDSGNFTSDGKGNLVAVSLTLNGNPVPSNSDIAAKYATITSLNSEVTRAQQAETGLETSIVNENTRATNAETSLQININDEVTERKEAIAALVTSVNDETTRAEAAETNLQNVANTKANLNIPNIFTGDQTITGNVTASGDVTAKSYNIDNFSIVKETDANNATGHVIKSSDSTHVDIFGGKIGSDGKLDFSNQNIRSFYTWPSGPTGEFVFGTSTGTSSTDILTITSSSIELGADTSCKGNISFKGTNGICFASDVSPQWLNYSSSSNSITCLNLEILDSCKVATPDASDNSTNAANTSWVNSKLSDFNKVTGDLTASGNIISQQSFICTGYAELVAGNNSANKLEITSSGTLNLYSNNTNIFNVSGTKATINGSLSTDNGKIVSNGSGQLTTLNLNTTGVNTFNSIINITNTSGMITCNSQGTSESWYLRRSASTVSSNKYTILSSNNGTSTNAVTFYDDGSITTTLGKVANLGTSNSFTNTVTVPTVDTTDNSTNAATTAWVTSKLASVRKIVNGDISATGSSMNLDIPEANVTLVLKNTSSTSASISYAAISGTVPLIDIRRVTMYGGGSNETYTLDGGSLTTTPTVVDDTIYTQSNDSSAHFIRVNGNVYVITVWISGSGARSSLMYEKAF